MPDAEFLLTDCADPLEEQERKISRRETLGMLLQDFLTIEGMLCGGLRGRFLRDGDGKVVITVYRCGVSRAVYRAVLKPGELDCVRRVCDEVTRVFSELVELGLVEMRDLQSKEVSDEGR